MKRPRIVALVIVAAILTSMLGNSPPASAVEARYTVTDLSAIWENSFAEPENVTAWYATAINNVGQIAGYAETTYNEPFAFVWDPVNGLRDFAHLEGASWTYAINNMGQVALDGSKPYVCDPNTGLQEVVGWGSGPIRLTDINDLGMVVGRHTTDAGLWQAFVWQDGTMRNFGTLGGEEAGAEAINDLAQVVGWSDTSDWSHAFRWDADNGFEDLGSLGRGSIPTDINNAGQVVGYSGTGTHGQRAFLWEAGSMLCIDTLGGETSNAASINNRGEVVGTWQLPEYEGTSAFLWSRTEGMVDMNSLISTESGCVLVQAFDINDNGYVIATAVREDAMGDRQVCAVLLRPVPEASTVILLFSGMAGLFAHVWSVSISKRKRR